jgi:predicted metal-binding protein
MNHKAKKSVKQTELSDKELCVLVQQVTGVIAVRRIPTSDVETAPWVRLKCQFGCGCYGECLVCPPFTPTPDQMRAVLDSYSRAILIHFDAETDIKATVADLERTIFLRGAWKAFGLGAGPCYFCKQCELTSKECRHPERARPAMEACGIDVFSTVRKAGFTIEVVRNQRQCPNYYGLILVD